VTEEHEPCVHQVARELQGMNGRCRYNCSTFYCPYPERQCGVRAQVRGGGC